MQPVCCELPDIAPAVPGAFEGCHDHGHKSGSSHGHEAHNHGDKEHSKRSAEESHGMRHILHSGFNLVFLRANYILFREKKTIIFKGKLAHPYLCLLTTASSIKPNF